MIVREDRLGNFETVVHVGTGDEFLIHQEDVQKLGTRDKVSVYAKKGLGYIAPGDMYPKGRYVGQPRFFVASFLKRLEHLKPNAGIVEVAVR